MKFFRKDRFSPVWRDVPEEKLVNTVFLTKDIKTKFCTCCKKRLPVVDFYLESISKRKYKDQLRNMCVSCWDERKGRLTPYQEIEECIDIFGNNVIIVNKKKTFKRKFIETSKITIEDFT